MSHETKWVQKIQVRIHNDFDPIVKFFSMRTQIFSHVVSSNSKNKNNLNLDPM